jgi:hypothetical protein
MSNPYDYNGGPASAWSDPSGSGRMWYNLLKAGFNGGKYAAGKIGDLYNAYQATPQLPVPGAVQPAPATVAAQAAAAHPSGGVPTAPPQPQAAPAAAAPQQSAGGMGSLSSIYNFMQRPQAPFQGAAPAAAAGAPAVGGAANVPLPPQRPATDPNWGWGNSDPYGGGDIGIPAKAAVAGPASPAPAAAPAADPMQYFGGPGSMSFGAGDGPSGNNYGLQPSGQDLVKKFMGLLMNRKS